MESYKTILSQAEGVFKEKGSRFLSFAFPVDTEADVRNHLQALQKKYFDARHHCYAYMLGAEKKTFRAFDDGEPNHSAGDPILGQLRSRDLTNVMVVVVRYFGGTKLGVGGLIAAYRTAASLALDNAPVVVKPITRTFVLSYDYAQTPVVMKLVKDFGLTILDEQFDSSCQLTVSCERRREADFVERLELLNATGAAIEWE